MNKATTVLAPPGAGYLRGEARERAEPLEMLADEYLLEGQGERARTGILLIHGLTGTPNEMRVLARGLHLQGYTVYAVKLAGHCGTLDDLVGTSWLDWLASVRRGADLLSRRVDRVVVGGLSMGAVLALALAQERPEHIAGVLALSPAFRHDGWSMPRYTKLACLLPVMRALGIGRRSVFMEQPPYGIRTRRCAPAWFRRCTPATAPPRACRATPGGRWWKCTSWRARCCATCRLRAPCLVMHARNDDIASVSNAYEIQRRAVNAPVTLQLLDDSYHMITIDRERRVVIARAAAFVTELVEGAKPGAAPMWNEAMTPLVVTLWILNLLFDSVGQLIFKAAAVDPKLGEGAGRWRRMARRPWLWLGIGCYVLEFVLWLAFISLVPLSDGVLLGSISIVVVMLLGRVFFRERLTPLRVLGILLVSLGVGIVGLKG